MEKKENYEFSTEITKQLEVILQNRYTEILNSSRILSDTMQKLAVSGVAIAWLFKEKSSNDVWFIPICLFILTLLIDLYYYSVRMKIYKKYTTKEYFYRKEIPDNPKTVKDVLIEIPSNLYPKTERIWGCRFIFTFIGYLLILILYLFGM